MKILGLETSCDETSVAIVEDGRKIISHIVASSQEIHKKTGGIIPEIAAREQIKCIIPVINEALEVSNVTIEGVDAIAVTIGPGLIGSLLVGVESAKTISFLSGKPIIPVNHILAHIYANFLCYKDLKHLKGGRKDSFQVKESVTSPPFPAIALIVSGGHTELFFIKDHNRIKWLGGTLDDAAGECFDKTARLLGLGYPGGPVIAASAAQYQISNIKNQKDLIKLPRPMINSNDYNFSFSGLKTAVIREVKKLKRLKSLNNYSIQQLSSEIQESITDVLVYKTLEAAKKYKVRSVLIGGGVAANKRLTEKFKLEIGNCLPADEAGKLEIGLFIPPPSLCTDNAAYIASFAFFHNHPVPWQEIQAKPDLDVEV